MSDLNGVAHVILTAGDFARSTAFWRDLIRYLELKLVLDSVILTPDARAEGFGSVMTPRLSLMASQVSDAFNTKERVDAKAVWNGDFLPPAAQRDIFKTAKK